MEKYMHWIDNADSYVCPICRFEARPNPSKYKDCKCPKCGFQDEKDKNQLNKYLITSAVGN